MPVQDSFVRGGSEQDTSLGLTLFERHSDAVRGDDAPVLLWSSDNDGLCEQWLTGVHPDDIERCLGIYRASFDARRPFSADYRLRQRDGSYRWMLANAVPRHGPDGRFEGYAGSCVDIDERKQLEDHLADRARE